MPPLNEFSFILKVSWPQRPLFEVDITDRKQQARDRHLVNVHGAGVEPGTTSLTDEASGHGAPVLTTTPTDVSPFPLKH